MTFRFSVPLDEQYRLAELIAFHLGQPPSPPSRWVLETLREIARDRQGRS